MHIGKKDKDERSGKQKALEEQIDAMLDPKRPAGSAAPDSPAAEVSDKELPKVNAVSTAAEPAGTAPALSDDLRKKIGVSKADTKPLSIDKLDEITGKISDSDKSDDKAKPKEKEKPEADDGPNSPAKPAADDKPAPQKDLDEDTAGLDDARTDEAVDDIVSHEGDVMLAVEDATRKEHNPQLAAPKDKHKKNGHHILATVMWTLVVFISIIAVLLLVLLITGGEVTAV